jgi:hypothetical protein
VGEFEERLAAAQAKEQVARAQAASKSAAAAHEEQRRRAEMIARARALLPEVRTAAAALQRSGRMVRTNRVSYWDGRSYRGGRIRRALARSAPGWRLNHLFVPTSGQAVVVAGSNRLSLEEFVERGSISWTVEGFGSSSSSTETAYADREFDDALSAIAQYLA